MIETKIEIASSPEHVREVVCLPKIYINIFFKSTLYTNNITQFLDFPSIPSYHTGTIKSVARADPSKPTIDRGDVLNCEIGGLKFSPTIIESSPTELSWKGPPWHGLIAGFHIFRFEPSQTTPGWTTFTQAEEFTGLLAFLLRPSMPLGKSTKADYEKFNQDIKARVESLKA